MAKSLDLKDRRTREIISTTLDPKTGKIYRGTMGEQLLKKRLEKQEYYKRNKKGAWKNK